MQDPLNLSDVDFDAVMVEIDRTLRERSDKIPGREILGLAEFCAKFNLTLYNTHPTARRIIRWFTRMYGERLGIGWDFGRSVVLVKGEILKIRGLRFFGSIPLVCSPGVMGIKLQQSTPNGPIKVYNLVDDNQIQGLTPEMAKRLSAEECAAILKSYGRMFLAFSRLEAALGKRYDARDAPYINEAMHDLIASVESLLTSPPSYGASKWSSLQAVEKVVKSCIREKGVIPKKSHNLAGLCATAAAAGVPAVDPLLIEAVRCAADVRYDSTLVKKLEAIEAHYAALTICGELAPIVKRTTAQSGVYDYEFALATNSLQGILLGYKPPEPPFIAPTGLVGTP